MKARFPAAMSLPMAKFPPNIPALPFSSPGRVGAAILWSRHEQHKADSHFRACYWLDVVARRGTTNRSRAAPIAGLLHPN